VARPSQWPPWAVNSLRGRLEDLELVITTNGDLPDEARQALARFLLLRSCGYLEQVVLEVCRGYVNDRSGGPVRVFANTWLARASNPTPEALCVLVGRFDAGWGQELGDVLGAEDQRLHRELEFLVDRRNRIAHGLNEGIGLQKALVLKGVAYEVADWFILRFNPT
jgi:hypothetical protein